LSEIVDTANSVAALLRTGIEMFEGELGGPVIANPCSTILFQRKKGIRKRQKMLVICKGKGKFKFIDLDKLMDELESIGEKESS